MFLFGLVEVKLKIDFTVQESGAVNIKKFFSLGPVLIVTAAILWALDGIIRRSLFTLPPVTIVFYEHLIGSLLFVPLVFPILFKKTFSRKVWGLTVAVSLLSGLLGTLWFTTALVKTNFIPFSVVFLLQKLQPLFAIVSAHFLLKEKITKGYGKWAVLALISAYFVTFPNGLVNFATGSGTVVAALYAVGAAAAWGSATALSKMLINETKNHTVATGLRFFVTTIFALVAVVLFGATSSLGAVEASQLGRLVFIAFSTGAVALWIYYKGLQKTEAKISTLLELTFPLLAVFIDAILFKVLLAPSQYFAAVVLMFAIFQLGKLQVRLNK